MEAEPPSSRFCRIMEQSATGKRIYPVPRCRRRNGTAKIRFVKGGTKWREWRFSIENTTRPFTKWVGLFAVQSTANRVQGYPLPHHFACRSVVCNTNLVRCRAKLRCNFIRQKKCFAFFNGHGACIGGQAASLPTALCKRSLKVS